MPEIKISIEANVLTRIRKFSLEGSPIEVRDLVAEVMGNNREVAEAVLNAAIVFLRRPENKVIRDLFVSEVNG